MKKMFLVIFLISISSICFSDTMPDEMTAKIFSDRQDMEIIYMRDSDGNFIPAKCEKDGSQSVVIQDQYTNTIDLYFHTLEAETTIATAGVIDDLTVEVVSIMGITVGHAFTIVDQDRIFQSIVRSKVGNYVGMYTPLDYAFSASSEVYSGEWNLNLSTGTLLTPEIAYVFVPPLAKYDIYTITFSMTDGAAMDSSKFGGISALTNGIMLRHVDGMRKNLTFMVNNLGFSEQGFDLVYDPKAPAGVYGIRAKKNYHDINGVSIRLNGANGERLQLYIRDDLSDLTSINATINGHKVEE